MNKINLLKKYAYNYLSKYDSSKKNLEWKLRNKIIRMRYFLSSLSLLKKGGVLTFGGDETRLT